MVGPPRKWRIYIVSKGMEDMHCFSFLMVCGLSSNKVLYSTSNQFLNVNKKLLLFSTLGNNFSSWDDFCVCPVFRWVSIGKNGTKNVKNEMSRLSIEGEFKLSGHYVMNDSVFEPDSIWENSDSIIVP